MPGAPTHGPWCKTRTWPTNCPQCRQSVFYFSCTCGSGVFFDCLGPPWPIHHHGNSTDPDLPPWLDDIRRTDSDLPPWLDDIRRIAAGSNVTIELRKLGISVIRPACAAGMGYNASVAAAAAPAKGMAV